MKTTTTKGHIMLNVATLAAWVIAGPNAAAKTHKIGHQIKKSRSHKKARPRPAMSYNAIMVAVIPIG